MTPPDPMSLQTLLAGLVDYAGLFPPAKLDMPTTIANYAEYLAGDDAWALGRLIVPVGRLDEFEQHAAEHLPADDNCPPWPLTALAGNDRLDEDLQRVIAFNDTNAGRACPWAAADTTPANQPQACHLPPGRARQARL